MFELDNKNSIQQLRNIEQEQERVITLEGDQMKNMFVENEYEEELDRFNKRVIKAVNTNEGISREKSFNPTLDKIEKKLVKPTIGVIYSLVQMGEVFGLHYKTK